MNASRDSSRTIGALFETEQALQRALGALRQAGFDELRTYTPQPLDEPPASSPLPVWILLAGLVGAAGGFAMQVYATGYAYPLDIGGRPAFSWPAYVPIAFEIGVLCAVLTAFVGFFVINRMPRLYDPIDELAITQEATRDGWVVVTTTYDEARLNAAGKLLASLEPRRIEADHP